MLPYIIRRLFLMVPTLLGVLAVVFFVMAFAPGGFGGMELSQEGAQTEGYDARRYVKQQQRRYGSDLPKIVQFGRWLNQISPVGFRMSDQIEFDQVQIDAVDELMAGLPIGEREQYRKRATKLALDIAAYQASAPIDAARQVVRALADPVAGTAMFEKLELELQPQVLKELRVKITDQLATRGLFQAQNTLVEELSFELSGVARPRMDQLAFKTPDLGSTIGGRRVVDRLKEAVPITVLLNVITIPIIYFVAIFTGVYAARHRGKFFDVASGFTFTALWSVPTIWVGVMFITYLANKDQLYLFPENGLHDLQASQMPFFPRFGDGGVERGWLLDAMWHLILPVVCLTYGGFAVMSRVMRGSMLDNLSAHFVRTARAMGLSERVVLWRHTFRNGLLPLITMASSIIPALFAGSVVVENIFGINGMGRLGIDAAVAKDRDLVMATTLAAAIIGLLSELVRDVCYAIADPRVTYE